MYITNPAGRSFTLILGDFDKFASAWLEEYVATFVSSTIPEGCKSSIDVTRNYLCCQPLYLLLLLIKQADILKSNYMYYRDHILYISATLTLIFC